MSKMKCYVAEITTNSKPSNLGLYHKLPVNYPRTTHTIFPTTLSLHHKPRKINKQPYIIIIERIKALPLTPRAGGQYTTLTSPTLQKTSLPKRHRQVPQRAVVANDLYSMPRPFPSQYSRPAARDSLAFPLFFIPLLVVSLQLSPFRSENPTKPGYFSFPTHVSHLCGQISIFSTKHKLLQRGCPCVNCPQKIPAYCVPENTGDSQQHKYNDGFTNL